MERLLRFIISQEDSKKTIKELLRYKYFISHRLLIKLKQKDKGIILNGERVFVTKTVEVGDILELFIEDEDEFSKDIVPTKGILDIIYEDEDILIINKPPLMPVHPSKGHFDDSLANITAHYFENKGQKFTFRCINRLDRGTSGLLAVAKNAYCAELLKKQLNENIMKREYLAVVDGHLEKKEGTIDLPIRRIPDTATIKREVSPDGERAITHYKVLEETECFSLISVILDTGRTHQIRVHFSHLGHPLVGDFLYGKEEKELILRQALHSHKLTLLQPITKKPLSFVCELPQDIDALISEI